MSEPEGRGSQGRNPSREPFRFLDPIFLGALNPAVRGIPLLRALYLVCVPLASVLHRLGWSPTRITHASNAVALLSVWLLASGGSAGLFAFLWFSALALDVADGIVARATGQGSATGSYYDHMSDVVKVVLVLLATALRYDTPTFWIVAFTVNSLFLFMSLVNYVFTLRSLRLSLGLASQVAGEGGVASPAAAPMPRTGLRAWGDRHPVAKQWLLGAYASIVSLYGNSMLFLLPLGAGADVALLVLCFFGLLVLRSLLRVVRLGWGVSKDLAAHGIPWK